MTRDELRKRFDMAEPALTRLFEESPPTTYQDLVKKTLETIRTRTLSAVQFKTVQFGTDEGFLVFLVPNDFIGSPDELHAAVLPFGCCHLTDSFEKTSLKPDDEQTEGFIKIARYFIERLTAL